MLVAEDKKSDKEANLTPKMAASITMCTEQKKRESPKLNPPKATATHSVLDSGMAGRGQDLDTQRGDEESKKNKWRGINGAMLEEGSLLVVLCWWGLAS